MYLRCVLLCQTSIHGWAPHATLCFLHPHRREFGQTGLRGSYPGQNLIQRYFHAFQPKATLQLFGCARVCELSATSPWLCPQARAQSKHGTHPETYTATRLGESEDLILNYLEMHDNYATKVFNTQWDEVMPVLYFIFKIRKKKMDQFVIQRNFALPVSPPLIFRSLNFHHRVSRLHTHPRTHCAPQNMLLQLHRY